MHKANQNETHCRHDTSNITRRTQQLRMPVSYKNHCACGPAHYPPKYKVSGSELLKRDFIQLKDTLGNLPVKESQALPQHKTGV